jgi:hypothetical protein
VGGARCCAEETRFPILALRREPEPEETVEEVSGSGAEAMEKMEDSRWLTRFL